MTPSRNPRNANKISARKDSVPVEPSLRVELLDFSIVTLDTFHMSLRGFEQTPRLKLSTMSEDAAKDSRILRLSCCYLSKVHGRYTVASVVVSAAALPEASTVKGFRPINSETTVLQCVIDVAEILRENYNVIPVYGERTILELISSSSHLYGSEADAPKDEALYWKAECTTH